MKGMFYKCFKLRDLNLLLFKTKKNTKIEKMFQGHPLFCDITCKDNRLLEEYEKNSCFIF